MRPQIRLHDGEHWAIVDAAEPEQVLFCGTKRQCEDWLDQFEIRQRASAQAQVEAGGADAERQQRADRVEAAYIPPSRGLFAWFKSLFSGKSPSSRRG
jgi:hypothetical protein